MTASLSRVQARHWTLVVIGALASWATGVARPEWVVAGGAAMGASVILYAAAFRGVVERRRARLALGALFVKLPALLGIGWFVLASRTVRPDPLGFTIGVTCFVTAAVWEAARARGN